MTAAKRKKISKAKLEQAREYLQLIQQCKDRIAMERDVLRDLVENVTAVLDSTSDAVDQVQRGLDELQSGIEQMSEYL